MREIVIEPHVLNAIWCMIGAFGALVIGWLVDAVRADMRKNKRPPY